MILTKLHKLKDLDPDLFEAVCSFMLHGPCGSAHPNAPCMEKGLCSKGDFFMHFNISFLKSNLHSRQFPQPLEEENKQRLLRSKSLSTKSF